ncbi:PREDICTED: protein transport protein SFT2-like [Amphimedon queenslandica]|nr:PREDICTED: protein transport protein SFT2-like [Amphimedon queenslandica]|eukprot:XP_003387372.1 PREDICTED: protein transport protein SFT2-like [Amphimedon queenslandica]
MEGKSNSIARALSSLWGGNGSSNLESGQTDSIGSGSAFGLSKKERIVGFFLCLGLGILCFALALALTPMILLKSRKFAALFTMGSLFSLGSFSFLWGPWSHLKHLLSRDRLPFTAVYVGTIIATLYFALGVHSTILTLFCAALQILALIWFLVSYIPGGTTGLSFMLKLFSGLCTRTVSQAIDA